MPDRFFLTVGAIGARKNQLGAIRAYASSGLHGQEVDYVLCGGSEQPGHAEALAAAEQTPGVHMLAYVDNTALIWLYAHADGFVLASRLEGFGMPIAEAMAVGVVPAVSRASVLEEVAGPGGIFFDPENDAEIAGAMVRLAHMPDEERATRRVLLSKQLAQFSETGFRCLARAPFSHTTIDQDASIAIRRSIADAPRMSALQDRVAPHVRPNQSPARGGASAACVASHTG